MNLGVARILSGGALFLAKKVDDLFSALTLFPCKLRLKKNFHPLHPPGYAYGNEYRAFSLRR